MAKLATSTKGVDLVSAIEHGRRDHFRELLATMLECQPSPAAIKKAANSRPDSFFKSLKTVSELAGYQTGHVETTNNILIQMGTMSDSALIAELESLQGKLTNTLTQPAREKPLEATSRALVPIYDL